VKNVKRSMGTPPTNASNLSQPVGDAENNTGPPNATYQKMTKQTFNAAIAEQMATEHAIGLAQQDKQQIVARTTRISNNLAIHLHQPTNLHLRPRNLHGRTRGEKQTTTMRMTTDQTTTSASSGPASPKTYYKWSARNN
jgi:hypothetical protein